MSHAYVVVMSYPDRSGVLGVFGPFADKTEAAHMAETIRPESLRVAYGVYDVLPLLDQFGFPVTQHNAAYGVDMVLTDAPLPRTESMMNNPEDCPTGTPHEHRYAKKPTEYHNGLAHNAADDVQGGEK
jgi:hypothetical protein